MKIYTDGSYNKKISPNTISYSVGVGREENDTTYNIEIIYGVNTDPDYVKLWNVGAEIWAVLVGLDYIIHTYNPKDIIIYHDYIGLSEWISGKWKVKNKITSSYKSYIDNIQNSHSVNFIHVPGHSNILLNEIADKYASIGTLNYLKYGILTKIENNLCVSKE